MPETLSSCPFYGVRIIEFAPGELPSAAALIATKDERCALITEAPSPCILQLAGTRPDWLACARNPANTDESYLVAITPRPKAEEVAEFGRRFEAMGHVELLQAAPTPVVEKLRALSEVKEEE